MSLLWALPWGWSAQVLPFLPMALLVLCPVLFDVSAFMPQLKPLCGIIPVTYYLRGDALPNLLLGGLFLLLGMGINKMKNSKN